MSIYKAESPRHKALILNLLNWLKEEKGFDITGADVEGYAKPKVVENSNNIGDGEDKMPDIDAKDHYEDVFVRGEAKTGDGDLVTLHTETQFRLFANKHNTVNGKASLLYIIVPASKIEDLRTVLCDLGLLDKPNVIPVKSGSVG